MRLEAVIKHASSTLRAAEAVAEQLGGGRELEGVHDSDVSESGQVEGLMRGAPASSEDGSDE